MRCTGILLSVALLGLWGLAVVPVAAWAEEAETIQAVPVEGEAGAEPAPVEEPEAEPTIEEPEPEVEAIVVTPAEGEVEVVVDAPGVVVAAVAQDLSIEEQADRAEAEEEVKLGEMALAAQEYEQARLHFRRALEHWPGYTRAQAGLDEALRMLGEREEPVIDQVRTQREIERGRIIANVQELIAESERDLRQATRPEGYGEALQPLDEADRVIDRAKVLTPEEAERLREEVFALRSQIVGMQKKAEAKRRMRAEVEARLAEQQRLAMDRVERARKIEQLWNQARELRKSMQFKQAIEVLDRLIAIQPENKRAHLWRDDLLYLESQARQVDIRSDRHYGQVGALTEVEEASIHPGEVQDGETRYLRWPGAKTWEALSKFRREFTKGVQAEPQAVADTRRRLSEKIDLDFERTSLDNVLKYIGEVQRGLNIVVDPEVEAQGFDLASRVVDLKVNQVSVEAVLNLILGADLGYKVEPGYVLVTTRDKLQQNLPIVTYPVQDLVAQIPNFGGQAPRFEVGDITEAAAGAGAGGGFGELFGTGEAIGEEEGVGWQDLVDIIQRNVNALADPTVAGWVDEGGPAAIDYMNGLLIVTQTRNGHVRVADLLDKLRRERAIMISVESRFIQVTDDFLQDITLDVDVSIRTNTNRWNTGGRLAQDPSIVGFDTLPGIGDTNVVQAPMLDGFGNVITDADGNPIFTETVTAIPQHGQPITVSQTGSNGAGTASLLPLANTAFQSFTGDEGGLIVSGVFMDDVQVGFLMRAIQADVRTHTLFAPRITLYNGQRGYISVSSVVTYIADAEPVVAEAAVAWDPVIASIPVGATLDVKATVSADRRYVQMDLRPQVADVTLPMPTRTITAAVPGLGIATVTIDLPVVQVEDFKTTVSVPDSGTILLGGNKRMLETEAETGVPVLSKIPILRRLFNNRASVRRATNLLILVRPKILIQAEEEHKLGFDDL